MTLKQTLFIFLLCYTHLLSASPLAVQMIDIDNMRQSECLSHGQSVFQTLHFLDVKTVDNTTVFAQDPPYYAAILCHAEKGTVYLSISGKQATKTNQFVQHIDHYFKQAVIQSSLCQLNADNWEACDNQRVQLKGYVPAPHQILPAPMLNAPFMPSMQQETDNTTTIQSYMNVANRQVILLSNQPIPCLTGLQVIGTLSSVALGGAPKTPNSYKGWSVQVDQYFCLP